MGTVVVAMYESKEVWITMDNVSRRRLYELVLQEENRKRALGNEDRHGDSLNGQKGYLLMPDK